MAPISLLVVVLLKLCTSMTIKETTPHVNVSANEPRKFVLVPERESPKSITYGAAYKKNWEERFKNTTNTALIWWLGPNVCREKRLEYPSYTDDYHLTMLSKHTGNNEEEYEDNDVEANFFYSISKDLWDWKKHEMIKNKKLNNKLVKDPIKKCKVRGHRIICTKSMLTKEISFDIIDEYKCCINYDKLNSICVRKPDRNIINKLKNMENSRYTKLFFIQKVDIILERNTHKPKTIFVLSKKAFEMLQYDRISFRSRNNSIKSNAFPSYTLYEVLLAQIAKNSINLRRDCNNKLYKSALEGSIIRINKYVNENSTIITANCAPIQHWNPPIIAPNGVIYITNSLVPPTKLSIVDILLRSSRATYFRKFLKNKIILDMLQTKEPYTFFLPDDKSFERLNILSQSYLNNMTSCGVAIIKNLMVKDVHCSATFSRYPSLKLETFQGSTFTVKKRLNSAYFVIDERINILKTDIMAINGVVHLVDDFVFSDSSMDISQIMKKYRTTRMLEKLNEFKLLNYWNNLSYKTFFLPNNNAFRKFKYEGRLPAVYYVALLGYLVGRQVHNSANLYNNQLIKTELEDSVRINVFGLPEVKGFISRSSLSITCNCAQFTVVDIPCCNGIAHILNNIVLPPTGNVWELIKKSPDLQTFYQIARGTPLMEVLVNAQNITFFAPTNKAWESINNFDFKTLLMSKKKIADFFYRQLLDGVHCCSSIMASTPTRKVAYKSYNSLYPQIFHRNQQGLEMGDILVTECDIMATNGILHYVEPLPPTQIFYKSRKFRKYSTRLCPNEM